MLLLTLNARLHPCAGSGMLAARQHSGGSGGGMGTYALGGWRFPQRGHRCFFPSTPVLVASRSGLLPLSSASVLPSEPDEELACSNVVGIGEGVGSGPDTVHTVIAGCGRDRTLNEPAPPKPKLGCVSGEGSGPGRKWAWLHGGRRACGDKPTAIERDTVQKLGQDKMDILAPENALFCSKDLPQIMVQHLDSHWREIKQSFYEPFLPLENGPNSGYSRSYDIGVHSVRCSDPRVHCKIFPPEKVAEEDEESSTGDENSRENTLDQAGIAHSASLRRQILERELRRTQEQIVDIEGLTTRGSPTTSRMSLAWTSGRAPRTWPGF
ncbi:hypothetical protein GGX14DRAFT_654466 [Mycena pura]|uniref:Uncharacterized protein n=1 Tax=Mycena pura TaxID=153505 RepID=A0AAD6V4E3_9AGAR|nr:hypothetical protein GGX14DRAFT_654466 [Mycena pura]